MGTGDDVEAHSEVQQSEVPRHAPCVRHAHEHAVSQGSVCEDADAHAATGGGGHVRDQEGDAREDEREGDRGLLGEAVLPEREGGAADLSVEGDGVRGEAGKGVEMGIAGSLGVTAASEERERGLVVGGRGVGSEGIQGGAGVGDWCRKDAGGWKVGLKVHIR